MLVKVADKWLKANLLIPIFLKAQDTLRILLVFSLTRRDVRALGVGDELLLILVEQSPGVGLGVVDIDLQTWVERGALTVGAAGEGTLEGLPDLLYGQDGTVGGGSLEVLQSRVEPAEAEDEEGHDPGDDEE